MTKIGPGGKNTPRFPAPATGQPGGQPEPIPARNEGKALSISIFFNLGPKWPPPDGPGEKTPARLGTS